MFKIVQVTRPIWPPRIYLVKTLNIFHSRTNRPMVLKLSMYDRILEYFQDCSNDDLGLTLTHFTAMLNMGKC